ncbi:hypothetical protein NECAME_16754 [Necator americanus]|uniref:SCP domain-containing protein n=1 Tax=Necator americanus TaxID=51031 RepID=W2TWM5_NECAM|nr:hypothetical protein NECAME_16754 [Necator americanus]ETN85466.1 hypothetical protein NECAME_16754 [Necator americanus]
MDKHNYAAGLTTCLNFRRVNSRPGFHRIKEWTERSGRSTPTMLTLSWEIIFVLANVACNVAAMEVPKSFGCKNSLISDDWRKMVLDFHNSGRKNVAENKEASKDSKLMPFAKNMNELTWDCNIEHNAWLRACDNTVDIPQTYAELTES